MVRQGLTEPPTKKKKQENRNRKKDISMDSSKKIWTLLRKGNLKKEAESLFIAPEIIPFGPIMWRRIRKKNASVGGDTDEMVYNIIS